MGTKEEVLTLLKNSQQTVSGEKLAQQLNLSRTAIWKAIKELEKLGYHIESTSQGYRYHFSDVLNSQEIHQALASPIEAPIQITDISESTMKDAKLGALEGAPHFSLFLTDMQQAARGRFQRPFFSQSQQGIYMSLLLKRDLTLTQVPQYTVLAAVAVATAIDELLGIQTDIKWVNDIYYHGKKVCGILSEAISDVESGQLSQVIIGIGINFSIKQSDFPTEIQEKVTSLFPDGQATITRNRLIAQIWSNFYRLLYTNQLDYLKIYREKSFVLGKTVQFQQQGTKYEGIAEGITDFGELVVKTDAGPIVLSSGEISLEKIL